MRTRITVVVSIALTLCVAWAHAEGESAAQILEIVDANLTKVKDQTYNARIQVMQNGKVTKRMELVMKMKGKRQSLGPFTAPGDVRGMTILTTADGAMYVYLPSFKRVRRIASHVRNQGFLGTDFTPEELSTTAFTEWWVPTLSSEDEKYWVLDLSPKPETDTVYSRLKLWVSKKYRGAEKIESYGNDGKLKKTQLRGEWKDFGELLVPTKITAINHQTGSSTQVTLVDCKVNQGIPDSVFTKRSVLRSH